MSVNVRTLILPAGILPECAQERRAVLDAYFDDLLASVKAVPEGWEIDLNWPSSADYYVDPCIEQGLAWWKAGTDIAEIHRQVSHTHSGQLSLIDSWTLFSWSHWLAERRLRGEATNEVVILHVDDHTDLMTPRLILHEEKWRDAISGKEFDLYKPTSVLSAILNGAIGVGSFISPLVHSVPNVYLRHLSQTAPDEAPQDSSLVAKSLADTLLSIGALRPAVGIIREIVGTPNEPRRAAAKHYRFTRQLDAWLGELPDAPVLLHVDMDYFSNRYNGDSDWKARAGRHDPKLPEIMLAIDAVFKAITESGVASRIENVTVALSPGFFPAELWASSIDRMQEHLDVLGWPIRTPER
jgi:hypothetical protein